MIFIIGIYIATRVIGLLGVSKEDQGCQHILFPEEKYFYLILENKNLIPIFGLSGSYTKEL